MTNEIKMEKTALSPAKKKHRGASLNEKKARMGWVFILPFDCAYGEITVSAKETPCSINMLAIIA